MKVIAETLWILFLVLWMIAMLFYTKVNNDILKEVRTVTSEQRDATWCLVAPDNSCE